MATQVIWMTLAPEDVENIAMFIAKDSSRYAEIQSARFFERTEILKSQPEIGRIVPELGEKSIRQLNEGNYRMIYQVASDSRINILTVHHQRRLLSNNPLFKE